MTNAQTRKGQVSVEFSPSVYEHAARVIGKSPWQVSRDARLLSQGNIEAFRLYKHRPVVVGIDIYNLRKPPLIRGRFLKLPRYGIV